MEEKEKRQSPKLGRGRPRGSRSSEWTKENTRLATYAFDAAQYDRVADIAYDRRMTIKDTLKRIIALGLEQYDALGGFREGQGT